MQQGVCCVVIIGLVSRICSADTWQKIGCCGSVFGMLSIFSQFHPLKFPIISYISLVVKIHIHWQY